MSALPCLLRSSHFFFSRGSMAKTKLGYRPDLGVVAPSAVVNFHHTLEMADGFIVVSSRPTVLYHPSSEKTLTSTKPFNTANNCWLISESVSLNHLGSRPSPSPGSQATHCHRDWHVLHRVRLRGTVDGQSSLACDFAPLWATAADNDKRAQSAEVRQWCLRRRRSG